MLRSGYEGRRDANRIIDQLVLFESDKGVPIYLLPDGDIYRVFPLYIRAVGEMNMVDALLARYTMEEPSPVEAVKRSHSR